MLLASLAVQCSALVLPAAQLPSSSRAVFVSGQCRHMAVTMMPFNYAKQYAQQQEAMRAARMRAEERKQGKKAGFSGGIKDALCAKLWLDPTASGRIARSLPLSLANCTQLSHHRLTPPQHRAISTKTESRRHCATTSASRRLGSRPMSRILLQKKEPQSMISCMI